MSSGNAASSKAPLFVPGSTGFAERSVVLAATDVRGRAWVDAYTATMDRWVVDLFTAAVAGYGDGDTTGLALVAVGGYGRAELAPASDLDLLLLHDGRKDVADVAQAIWYPIWDAALKLGHAVRSPREALALAGDDLDTATSLLDIRCLAGDRRLANRLATGAQAAWQKRGRKWLGRLADSVETRQALAGEVAFLLEPDLKVGRGGLRDVHAMSWATRVQPVLLPGDAEALAEAYDVLLAARVELHRRSGRASDVLALQEQDGVADALGYADADALMSRIAAAGRTISWTGDETWERVRTTLSRSNRSRRMHALSPGVVGTITRSAWRLMQTRPVIRWWHCGSRPRLPADRPASTAPRSSGWRPKFPSCRRPGPMMRSTRWWPCWRRVEA